MTMKGQGLTMKDWTKTIVWGGILTACIIAFIWDITYNNGAYTTRCIDYIVNLVSNLTKFMDRWATRLFGSYRYQF